MLPESGRRFVPLQWGHDDGVVEDLELENRTLRLMRFNGATTMESWKTLSLEV